MPSKGGSSPAGSTTVNQIQTPWNAGALQYIQGVAQHLYQDNPINYYPGQTLATPNPATAMGYQGMINQGLGGVANILTNQANSEFGNIMAGGTGISNSPAYGGLYSNAYGLNPNSQSAYNDAIASAGLAPGFANNAYGYGGAIGDLASQAPALTGSAANYINSLAPQARQGLGDYSAQMWGLAQTPGNVYNAQNSLINSITAATGNPALSSLLNTANGAYLNSNPYLGDMYDTAARKVTNAYQTATAPQTDSNYELAGRYGSGAMMNARNQNEQNLGNTLNDLASNIYGQNYANERGLMVNAGGTAGGIANQLQGLGLQAATNLGNLAMAQNSNATNILKTAADTYGAGLNSAANLAASGAATGLSGINSGVSGLGTAAGTVNTGLVGANNAYATGGALNLNNMLQQNAALGGLQSGYQSGNTNLLQGLALSPSLINNNYGLNNAIIQGGQGLTGLDQNTINAQMQSYYGNQLAPWQTAQMAAGFIGGPYAPTTATTTPYFSNPTANALSGLTGGLGLLNGVNSAFGSGGALSGLFGGGSTLTGSAADAAIAGGLASDFSGGVGLDSIATLGGGGGFLDGLFGAGGLLGFLSDRRLKTDIKKVGALDNGLPVYRFRYIGDPAERIGLMADDVERVHPEAVVTLPSGFRAVHYGLASEAA